MIGAITTRTAIAMAVIVASVAATQTPRGNAYEQGGPRPPKVIQLSYREVNDGTRPPYRLEAYAYRTDSLRFASRYRGRTANAGSQYEPDSTDTDIKGKGEARHPWVLIHKGGGSTVLRLIRKSLNQRGVAKVRIRAKGDDLLDDLRLTIMLAKCAQDPPIYPVDCEITRTGKHI
jgi:hypothetical protein